MKRIASGSIGIDQGSRVLFSDFADGGMMWTGQGPRESRHRVVFKEPYADVPSVQVSISMWDLDQKTNARADISAENISATCFDLVFRTWRQPGRAYQGGLDGDRAFARSRWVGVVLRLLVR